MQLLTEWYAFSVDNTVILTYDTNITPFLLKAKKYFIIYYSVAKNAHHGTNLGIAKKNNIDKNSYGHYIFY